MTVRGMKLEFEAYKKTFVKEMTEVLVKEVNEILTELEPWGVTSLGFDAYVSSEWNDGDPQYYTVYVDLESIEYSFEDSPGDYIDNIDELYIESEQAQKMADNFSEVEPILKRFEQLVDLPTDIAEMVYGEHKVRFSRGKMELLDID